jgi:hypothetical protein
MKKILLLTICIPLFFNSCKKEEVEPGINDLDWRLINSERRMDYGHFETRIWNNSDYTYYNKHFTHNEIEITIPSDTINGYFDVTSTFSDAFEAGSTSRPNTLWESFHMIDGPVYANTWEWEIQGNTIYLSYLDLLGSNSAIGLADGLSIFFPDQWPIGYDIVEQKHFYTILSFNGNQLILNSTRLQNFGYIPCDQNIIQEDSVFYFRESNNILTFKTR